MSVVKLENISDSSTSESEVSACSPTYNPLKALYSDKVKVPVESAPFYENVVQFEAAQKQQNEVFPVGKKELVDKREQEKERRRIEEEKRLEEKNKQRFAQYGGRREVSLGRAFNARGSMSTADDEPAPRASPPGLPLDKLRSPPRQLWQAFEDQGLVPRKEFKTRSVLTRMEDVDRLGPFQQLKDWVDKRIRVKIVTRRDRGIRGVLHATIVAFDKQWNLALSDVHEIWQKLIRQEKSLPVQGKPVPKGTAATISSVPEVTKTHLGKGIWECTRDIPQLMVRGEHIVVIMPLVPSISSLQPKTS